MSLRAFHIVFIVVSVALSLVVTAWGVREYLNEAALNALAVGCSAAITGVALVVYGRRYFRKLQELG